MYTHIQNRVKRQTWLLNMINIHVIYHHISELSTTYVQLHIHPWLFVDTYGLYTHKNALYIHNAYTTYIHKLYLSTIHIEQYINPWLFVDIYGLYTHKRALYIHHQDSSIYSLQSTQVFTYSPPWISNTIYIHGYLWIYMVCVPTKELYIFTTKTHVTTVRVGINRYLDSCCIYIHHGYV